MKHECVIATENRVMRTTCLREDCASTRFCLILTYAFPLVGDSNGPSHDARCPSDMAGTGVHNSIVPAQVLIRRGHLRAKPVAGHAVGVVGLVQYTRRASRTAHIIA